MRTSSWHGDKRFEVTTCMFMLQSFDKHQPLFQPANSWAKFPTHNNILFLSSTTLHGRHHHVLSPAYFRCHIVVIVDHHVESAQSLDAIPVSTHLLPAAAFNMVMIWT